MMKGTQSMLTIAALALGAAVWTIRIGALISSGHCGVQSGYRTRSAEHLRD